jgi:hypothetical protein
VLNSVGVVCLEFLARCPVVDCSGTLHTEHPHLKKSIQLCKQHRELAVSAFRERLQIAVNYRSELEHKRNVRVSAVGFSWLPSR